MLDTKRSLHNSIHSYVDGCSHSNADGLTVDTRLAAETTPTTTTVAPVATVPSAGTLASLQTAIANQASPTVVRPILARPVVREYPRRGPQTTVVTVPVLVPATNYPATIVGTSLDPMAQTTARMGGTGGEAPAEEKAPVTEVSKGKKGNSMLLLGVAAAVGLYFYFSK